MNNAGLSTTECSNGLIIDTTPPVMIRVIDGFGDLDVDQQSFLKTIFGQVEAEDPLSGVWTYEWCVGTDEDPEGCSVMDWVSNYNETYVGAFDLEDVIEGETFKICGRATNVIGLRSEPMCSDGVLIGVAEAVVSKDKPTAVSFDSVDPNNAEGEATLGTVEIPAGAVEGETKFMATSKPIAGQDGNVDPNETAPPASNMKFGDYTFTMVAADDDGNPQHGYVFQKPIILTMQFKADQIFGDEGNADAMIPQLNLYDVETDSWINAKDSCDEPWEEVNWSTKIYSVAVCHLTQFGMFYQEKPTALLTQETEPTKFEKSIVTNATVVVANNPGLSASASFSGSTSTDSDGTIKAYAWSIVSVPDDVTEVPMITDYLDCDDASYADELADLFIYKPLMCSHTSCEGVDYTQEDLSSSPTICQTRGNVFMYPGMSRSVAYTEAQSVTIGNLYAGTYTIKLTVYDNNDAADSMEFSIFVNEAPDVIVNDVEYDFPGPYWPEVTPLDGSSSSDDSSIETYKWEQISGTTLNIQNDNNAIAGVGTYSFKLTCIDNYGSSSDATMTLTVNAGSMPPPAISVSHNYIDATATIKVAPGGVFRYTIDGTDPSPTEGIEITSESVDIPITSTDTITLKAISFEDSFISPIISKEVTLTYLDAPTLSIVGILGGKQLKVASSQPLVEGEPLDFLYTIDESDPVALGSIPEPTNTNDATTVLLRGQIVPVTTAGSHTFRVISRMKGFLNSVVAQQVIDIVSTDMPTIDVVAVPDAKNVTFACPVSDSNCVIKYTIDGSDPVFATSTKNTVDEPVELSFSDIGSVTVKAIAYVNGKAISAVTSTVVEIIQLEPPTLTISRTVDHVAINVSHDIATSAVYIFSESIQPSDVDLSLTSLPNDITVTVSGRTVGSVIAKANGYARSDMARFSFEVSCGNGILEPWLEECDDSATLIGDGCSETCTVEPEWDCPLSSDGLIMSNCILNCVPNESGCIDTVWVTDNWRQCSVDCEGGTQDRDVYCVNVATGRPVLDTYCVSMDKPIEVRECNKFECPTYDWLPLTWDGCDCDSGLETRSVLCKSSHGFISSASKCNVTDVENSLTQRSCLTLDVEKCSNVHWEYEGWSECTVDCGTGISSRTAVCYSGSTIVADSECESVVGDAVLDRDCNTAPCAVDVVAWIASDFGVCENVADPSDSNGDGSNIYQVRRRTITCQYVNPEGHASPTVLDSECEGLLKVSESEICPKIPTTFCEDNTCSFHGYCNISTDECECHLGYGGDYCETYLDCSGPLDNYGKCCSGTVYLDKSLASSSSNGGAVLDIGDMYKCCEGQIDRDGECCDGKLDACGICGGDAKVMDVSGRCCATVLDASGVCCESGILDHCGVCDGDNSCSLVMDINVELPSYIDQSRILNNAAGAVDDFKSVFGAAVANSLNRPRRY
eukprot:TRINITY_DN533_c0_g1_i11.p1 TRINITY_DN533_c0_g1~~TRINITY_DN533_c0_g1_i11.p1  ORF type:complete len:1616 (+),score=685.93 TRINITY_DN533_c0_g1_i11:580-4848(+)